jgi:uncharacterized repeat protein (TIGR03803 family)
MTRSPSVRRSRRFQRPCLEQLETRLTPSLSTLATFNGANGSAPSGTTMDSAGNIYGLYNGGIFEVVKGSGAVTDLASFSGTTVSAPMGNLLIDSAGNLYGTSKFGGANNYGSVYELAKGSNHVTILASFTGPNGNGQKPTAGLVMDGAGNLYGTTWGGPNSTIFGEIFELVKGSSTITVLSSFNGAIGQWPSDSLLMDGSGNLYGTTLYGGLFQNNPSGSGTVFELVKGSGVITRLAAFSGTDGASPQSSLLMDSSGNLYGTTTKGGANLAGTVFEVAQGSGAITTLASFNNATGGVPTTQGISLNLVMDGYGNLYGESTGGAYGDGAIFEIAQGSNTITTLYSFNGASGTAPYGGLLADSSGNFYGTTQSGGVNNFGTVFGFTPGTHYIFNGFQSAASGTGGQFSVTVQNSDGSINTGYTGTMHFTSSDSGAVLPADYTFSAGDGGVQTFTATLAAGGSQSITATDTGDSSISSQLGINVTGPAATMIQLTGYHSPTTAGTANNYTVTARDSTGNVATSYLGTVTFTSSDPLAALPGSYTFQASDNGTHTFSATLARAGSQSISATDTANGALTATQSGIVVTPGAATHLGISAPASVAKGAAFNVTVSALDAYGNIATSYRGTVKFSSSDARAKLPANYAFVAGDAGVHTFSVTLNTTGNQSLTAVDTKTKTITGTDSSISVTTGTGSVQARGNSLAISDASKSQSLADEQTALVEDLVAALFSSDLKKRNP